MSFLLSIQQDVQKIIRALRRATFGEVIHIDFFSGSGGL
jgi:hypothetical protein